MYVPKHWARAQQEKLCCLGWSDESAEAAGRLARERLAKALLRPGQSSATKNDWDYYPSLPVKEEILESPQAPGVNLLITRNRAGVQVLNTDRVAFIDIDLPVPSNGAGNFLKRLFGKPAPAPDPVADALAVIQGWAESHDALLRAYRTARGLRLLRMDQLMDPASEETDRLFAALGTDPQYQKLCKIQKSFRARLTPKPKRLGLPASPGSYPRTEAAVQDAFALWLNRYEQASRNRPVCAFVADYGRGRPVAAARAVADLHAQRTLTGEGPLL